MPQESYNSVPNTPIYTIDLRSKKLNFLRFANLSRLIATSPETTTGFRPGDRTVPEASLSRVSTWPDSSDSPSNWTLKMIPF